MPEKLIENDENTGSGANPTEELEITEVAPKNGTSTAEDDSGDERRARSSDENDINPDDPDDKEREAIRERRRLEKLERKERREKAINRDKLELDFLRKRNDDLERRVTMQEVRTQQQDLGAVHQTLAEAKREAEMADQVIAKAVAAGNGEDVIKAMRYRDEARAKIANLEPLTRQRPAEPQRMPGVDPKVVEHAKDFMEDHPWYDTSGRDEDSAIVLAIDQALAREGRDPTTEDYWDELRTRVERRLPDRVKKAEKERSPRGGPSIGSGREHAPTSTRTQVYISPERKQALIDAGVWDDPVLRMKYVKRYAEYDKNNRA